MMLPILAGLFLSFSNGANDNIKGVAVLLGAKVASYRLAITWASLLTFAGSVTAFFLAHKLLVNFSGKGLVPNEVLLNPKFPIAVATAAALTVFIATKFGLPISTTHALTGSLVGSGLMASVGAINFEKLSSSFFLPLFFGPLLAITFTAIIHFLLKFFSTRFKIKKDSCLCVETILLETSPSAISTGTHLLQSEAKVQLPQIILGNSQSCERSLPKMTTQNLTTGLHFLFSGLVSFARGLNDTPKIAGIMLAANTLLSSKDAIVLVAILMAVGGLLYSKKVAQTMSYQITSMNDAEAITANFSTSMIVLLASWYGLPVSTTHVSCGSLFGIGVINGKAHWAVIIKIISAWIVTLPLALILGAIFYFLTNGSYELTNIL